MSTLAQRIAHLSQKVHIRLLRKKYARMQLEVPELTLIHTELGTKLPANILVFGLGYDTELWLKWNQNGKTVFLENDEEWFSEIVQSNPAADAYKINYKNNITQWEELLESPEKLHIDLPEDVLNTSWDVIFIDSPQGWDYTEDLPGRMSSIYMASKLIKDGGLVLVHDCEREVEAAYADKYLGKENLLSYVVGRARLNIYQCKK